MATSGNQRQPAATTEESRRAVAALGVLDTGPAPKLVEYRPTLPSTSFVANRNADDDVWGVERSPDRVLAYVDAGDPYVFVEVTRQNDKTAMQLDAWALGLLRQEEFSDGTTTYEDFAFILVYLEKWTDQHARLNLEYAVVEKGCERGERFVRWVGDRKERLKVTAI